MPFNLEPKDIVIPTECPVLGIPLKRGEGAITDHSPTLDRITPEKGYVRGNVLVISNKANRMKSTATSQELLRAGCFYAQHYPSEE